MDKNESLALLCTANSVFVFVKPLTDGAPHTHTTGLNAPLGLCAGPYGMYVGTHLGHELMYLKSLPTAKREELCSVGSGLHYPWGIACKGADADLAQIFVASLNLDQGAKSYISACTVSSQGYSNWQRVDIAGGENLYGICDIR